MGILVEAPVDLQGVDRELNYNETTHYDNNSYATSDSHTTSVIQGDTDGGTGGSVAPTPSARAPFKRPAPAPKDSKTSESSPKRPRETRDAPDIESMTPLQKPPPEAPPAPNTGFSPNTTTGTDSTSTSVTEPTTNITIQINTDTGSSLNRTPGADPKSPIRCRVYRQNKKSEEVEQHEALLQCLKKPGSSTARDAVSTSKPLKIEVLDEPCGSVGSNNDDNIIYIVTKSAIMEATQKITKAAKWRSSDEFEFKFDVEPLQPSDEKKVKTQKSVRNSREKKKAVDALKTRMTETLNAENIALEANIKQLKQEQALLAQQHQQEFCWNSGYPTLTRQPQSQAQPQQQAQVVQSGASAGVQTITVNQQQPQVIQLQLQQQQQAQPQQQQQQQQQQQHRQAQPHHLQPGAAAVPPGGIQIVQQLITPTGEIHQIPPVQLNTQQLQVIRAQMVGGTGSSQPIVIHTAPIQTQLAHPAQTVQTIQLQGGQHVYNIQQQYWLHTTTSPSDVCNQLLPACFPLPLKHHCNHAAPALNSLPIRSQIAKKN